MSRITQRTLAKPDTSWRRNRSPVTVISNQNHRMNMKIAKTSARKFVNVKPPSNSMVVLPSVEHHGSCPPWGHEGPIPIIGRTPSHSQTPPLQCPVAEHCVRSPGFQFESKSF